MFKKIIIIDRMLKEEVLYMMYVNRELIIDHRKKVEKYNKLNNIKVNYKDDSENIFLYNEDLKIVPKLSLYESHIHRLQNRPNDSDSEDETLKLKDVNKEIKTFISKLSKSNNIKDMTKLILDDHTKFKYHTEKYRKVDDYIIMNILDDFREIINNRNKKINIIAEELRSEKIYISNK
jgi:hypothetical protein